MTWGQWASATEHRRYMQPVKTRRRCWCGCKRRATHAGFANGIVLTAPLCELAARRWVLAAEEGPDAIAELQAATARGLQLVPADA